jgi:hypothetical protein
MIMNPYQYWTGWLLMFVSFVATIIGACWYIGNKLDKLNGILSQILRG